jgi:hypothetical protein
MKAIEVDGSSYDLLPRRVLKPNAIYVDVAVRTCGQHVASFRLRCAAHEPQFEMLTQMPEAELAELAMRTITPDRVRNALWFESELRKQNPESPICGVLGALFPENYRPDTLGQER